MLIRFGLVFFIINLLPMAALAHHSRGYYSTEQQVFDAEIVEVHWRNPHISFTVRRLDDEKSDATWRVEAASIYMLKRTGVTRALFNEGDRISVVGFEHARDEGDFLATNILLANGDEAMVMPGAEPYFATTDNVGGSSNWQLDESNLGAIASEGKGILRVWSIPHRGGRISSEMVLTRSAQTARDQWDPLQSFALKCEQPGMARAMVGNPHPIEFKQQGDDLVIYIEENDVIRLVHMDVTEIPSEVSASLVGYSRGRWENNVLTVETSHVNWPFFDSNGTPQSEEIMMTERFTLSTDESRLDYEIIVIDPMTFTKPVTMSWYWLALGEKVEPYECVPG
jgi:hypothetical protein